MSTEKVNLSQASLFELRGNVTLKVYPASLETLITINPQLAELGKVEQGGDLKAQAEALVSLVYALIKEDNDITKEQLMKVLTLESGVRIMHKAMGTGSFVAPIQS